MEKSDKHGDDGGEGRVYIYIDPFTKANKGYERYLLVKVNKCGGMQALPGGLQSDGTLSQWKDFITRIDERIIFQLY